MNFIFNQLQILKKRIIFLSPDSKTCQEIDIDYYGNDAGSYLKNVASWEKCARLCSKSTSCFAWSWSNINKRCYFKNKNWRNDRKVLENIISGEKTCLGSEFVCKIIYQYLFKLAGAMTE